MWLWNTDPFDMAERLFKVTGSAEDPVAHKVTDVAYPATESTNFIIIFLDWCKIHIANILDYFTPQFFDRFIEVVVLENPWILIAGLIYLAVLQWMAGWSRTQTEKACEKARGIVLKSGKPVK